MSPVPFCGVTVSCVVSAEQTRFVVVGTAVIVKSFTVSVAGSEYTTQLFDTCTLYWLPFCDNAGVKLRVFCVALLMLVQSVPFTLSCH